MGNFKGLVAAILQEGKPITIASKALRETQVNFAQIEKEMLAVLFACRKFDAYIYDKKSQLSLKQIINP
jgi:hypothetical protein